MVAGPVPRRRRTLKNRQNGLDIPSTGQGINQSSSIVIDPISGTSAGTLAFDTTESAATSTTDFPLAGTITPTITSTPSVSDVSTSTGDSSPSSTSRPADHVNGLSTTTVTIACIVALVGAILLILIGVWLYRRYIRSLQNSHGNRNVAGGAQRRRSRLGQWNQLKDDNHDHFQMKETEAASPMDKMFNKPLSIRTGYTRKSDEPMNLGIPRSLAQYYPASPPSEAVTVHRPFLGRAESGPTISWDTDTVHEGVVTSQHLSTSSAANSASIAIPTPIATQHLHHWHSAEVLHSGAETPAPASNPFEAESGHSTVNPFFKGQDYPSLPSRTRSNSRTSSHARRAKDHAANGETSASAAPSVVHVSADSASSGRSNQHAIQSLIAALDFSEAQLQDRLRIASMQHSAASDSVYLEGTDFEFDASRPTSHTERG